MTDEEFEEIAYQNALAYGEKKRKGLNDAKAEQDKTYREQFEQAFKEFVAVADAYCKEPDWKAEYLKTVDLHCETLDELREAQAALKESFAQPEQEPVAWMYTSKWKGNERFITRYQSELTTYKADEVWPLYTSPPQRQPLSDEDIDSVTQRWAGSVIAPAAQLDMCREYARAIEAKLKEKNT